jgi:MscS family membrane protein
MEELVAYLPEYFTGQHFGINDWQWVLLIGLLTIGLIIDLTFKFGFRFIVKNNIPLFRLANNNLLEVLSKSLGKLAGIYFIYSTLQFAQLQEGVEIIVVRLLAIVLAIVTTSFLHKLVIIISYYLEEKAKETDAKYDDVLVPLISKTALIIVYVLGFILVAKAFNVNVSGLIAGLGIGGLAFAFAAKDSLANIFGSIMIVLDRPFDIGDVITAGDVEGTVVEVGFRSTRVRTFYDSLITISNGQLINRTIDNKGKRRYRRLNTTLGLEYDTPPHKIEAFCEGIRQLILSHKWTRKDNFHVYFSGYGDFSLNIQLVVFWETDDYARECAERHRLLVDILRLANDIEVGFAFPTSTVHLFNETKQAKKDLSQEKYLDEAIEKAQKVAKRPLSLQNPRSNGIDENQFGKNDIGL